MLADSSAGIFPGELTPVRVPSCDTSLADSEQRVTSIVGISPQDRLWRECPAPTPTRPPRADHLPCQPQWASQNTTLSPDAMGPAAFALRLCTRSTFGARTATRQAFGANFRSLRSRAYRSSQWRWSEQPRPPRYGRITLLAASNSAALGTLAFVEFSDRDEPTDSGATWESRLLEASRNELEAARVEKARNQPNKLIRILHGILSLFDSYLWEPICTGTRFLHLLVIFVPVIFTVPVIWAGRRLPDRDNERRGTLWWYSFLVKSMEWSGPAFIKASFLKGPSALCSSPNLLAAGTMGCIANRHLPDSAM